MIQILRFLLCSLLVTVVLSASGQVSFDSKEQLEQAADEAFRRGEFETAKPLYSQLLSLNALDPNYNYRFGVCILYTEADPLKPLPYIEGGANSEGVNIEAYYYLGKAYQYNYRFDDAIRYFQKAKNAGFTAQGVDLEKSMDECRNGKLLYDPSVDFQPAADKVVIESEFYRPYDFRKLKGKVIPMPPSFKTKYDQKYLTGTVVYTPSNSQTLFYASYGEDGANAKDLYRVNRLPNGEWSLPVRLPETVNTRYDEDYAFFDTEEQTLFFASKGHNTMGGYDVFRTQYDPESDQWSQPINLQYPINSPYDDFLYVSDPDGKVAFFTSNRTVEAGKVHVYRMLLHDPSMVELSVIEGSFEDRTDSLSNYMLATVLDPRTNEVIGKYRSNRVTGKYVLLLPPQNDYVMDVAPREASGFKFDLDVPQHEMTKPLQQQVVFESDGDDAVVSMVNYFNQAGEPDSVVAAAKRPMEAVLAQMVALPESDRVAIAEMNSDELNQKSDRINELANKEQSKLNAELAKMDSVKTAKASALEAEVLRIKDQEAKRDSLAKAEQLAQEQLKKELLRKKSIADSLAQAELAQKAQREQARQDSLQASAQALAQQTEREREARERSIADSLAQAELAQKTQREQARQDSLQAAAEALAQQTEREREARERSIADSLAQVELALKAQREQARQDSLQAAAQALAQQAEKEREAIERSIADSLAQAELAQKAQHSVVETANSEMDSLLASKSTQQDQLTAESTVSTDTATSSFDALLKEMQETEAAMLAEQVRDTTLAQYTETTSDEPQNQLAQLNDSLATEQVISEADLYLQTLANIEKQKRDLETEVARENEERQRKTEIGTEETGVASDSIQGTALSVTNDSIAPADPDLRTQSGEMVGKPQPTPVALKSNVDPNEYLSALAEAEKAIAEADRTNNRSYELKELPPLQRTPARETDPKVQQMLEADRKAIEEHQRVAAEKEKELERKMAKEKLSLDSVLAKNLTEDQEIAAIEKQLLEGLEQKKKGEKLTLDKRSEILEESESTVTTDTTMALVEEKTLRDSIFDTGRPITNEEAEQPIVLTRAEVSETEKATADSVLSSPSEEEMIMAEAELMVQNERVDEQENVPDQETMAADRENADRPTGPMGQGEKGREYETQTISNDKIAAESDDSFAALRTHTMQAALRNYALRKPDLSGIADPSVRAMVKRMRAEDIGRMAVIKKMRNDWVTQGKSAEALEKIKSNPRNSEVLAYLSEMTPQKEKGPTPFDRGKLRKRQGVSYKLQFTMEPMQPSEILLESMPAEQSMSYSLPVVTVTSDHYHIQADAEMDVRHYERSGFSKVKVVAFLNGVQIPLSDVANIPFVE